MKAMVDRNTCIGCGICESICPGVFKLDDENIAAVLVEPIPAEFEACAQEAQEECPVNAIIVE